MRGGKLKRKLGGDQPVFGPFVMLPAPGLVEIAGLAGFDFVVLDMEHGPHSAETVEHMVRAADAVDLPAIVRVADNSTGHITRTLETGASGVCVPHVACAEQAKAAVCAAKFVPLGERGVHGHSRAACYAHMEAQDYFRRANEEVLLVAQIEDRQGVQNIGGILEIEGLDLIFIGPYDLSQSYRLLGQVADPKLQEIMLGLVRDCRARGRAVGIFEPDPERLPAWIEEGVGLFAVGTDVDLFGGACASKLGDVRRAIEGQ